MIEERYTDKSIILEGTGGKAIVPKDHIKHHGSMRQGEDVWVFDGEALTSTGVLERVQQGPTHTRGCRYIKK